jgi:gluconokinase
MMVIVVMGVAGAGKTVVGQQLAAAIGAAFYDADDFHSAVAVQKMQSGQPLDDIDRAPWLGRLAALIETVAREKRNAVMACSALKESYRAKLRAAARENAAEIPFVYLRVTPEMAAQRLRERPGHYMPAALIQSQFDALEEPADAIAIDAAQPIEANVAEIRGALESGARSA